eukprot:680002-Rhodomonas_salina.2
MVLPAYALAMRCPAQAYLMMLAAYALSTRCPVLTTSIWCYALRGTEPAYGATRWKVPLTPLALGTVVTAPPKFRDSGVGGKKIPNVTLSNNGSTCKITGMCLRACDAVSGTNFAYGATRRADSTSCGRDGTRSEPYGPTRALRGARY